MLLTDIALRLDIPTAITHRILTTLQMRGYVNLQEHDQTWTIGIEAYRTGSAYLNQTDLLVVSCPIMRSLMEQTGETVNLAIPDGFDVVFVS
jgi:IclR family acetate operon transcriptional repressor